MLFFWYSQGRKEEREKCHPKSRGEDLAREQKVEGEETLTEEMNQSC